MIKRAIVTGASSGIGRAAAVELAKAGVELVLAARSEDKLEALRAEIGGTCVKTDVRDEKACIDLIQRAKSLGPAYPVLINAAGVGYFGAYGSQPFGQSREMFEANFVGPAILIHEALPWMLEGGGQIINVLSVTVAHTLRGASAYSASKAALQALGRGIAADYRAKGVRVTNFAPGAVDTPIWDASEFAPNRAEMIPVAAIGAAIRDLVLMPLDRNVDEMLIMPQKGIL